MDPSIGAALGATLVGALLLRGLGYGESLLPGIGLAAGLGYGALSVVTLWLAVLGMGISATTGLAAAVLVVAASLLLGRVRGRWGDGEMGRRGDAGTRGRGDAESAQHPALSTDTITHHSSLITHHWFPTPNRLLTFLAGAGCLVLVATSFVEALSWPVYRWDAVLVYDSLARSFVEMGRVDFEGFKEPAVLSTAAIHYPPFSTMAHVWAYLFGGANPKIVYPLLYSGILAVYFGICRRRNSSATSALLTLVLAAVPILYEFSSLSNNNLPYGYFYSLGVIYYAEWTEGRQGRDLAVASLLLGLSAWARPGAELFFAPILLHACYEGVTSRRSWRPLAFAAPFAVVWWSWSLVRVNLIDQVNPAGPVVGTAVGAATSVLQGHTDLGMVASWMAGYLVDAGRFGVSWLLMLAFLVPAVQRHRGAALLVIGVVGFHLFSLGLFAYGYSEAVDWEVFMLSAVPRSLMSVMPLVLYVVSLGAWGADPWRSSPKDAGDSSGGMRVGDRPGKVLEASTFGVGWPVWFGRRGRPVCLPPVPEVGEGGHAGPPLRYTSVPGVGEGGHAGPPLRCTASRAGGAGPSGAFP